MRKQEKLKPGYYVAEAPATGNGMADSVYVVFRWTTAEQRIVDLARRQMRPLRRDGRWLSTKIVGPQTQFLTTLPDWIENLAGLRDELDSGKSVAISPADAEWLFNIEDNSVARVDCIHITVIDSGLYVGAYGKYCGTHYETRELGGE